MLLMLECKILTLARQWAVRAGIRCGYSVKLFVAVRTWIHYRRNPMHRLPHGQFSILALVAALGGVFAPSVRGADLPPFAVDPVLLGLPPAKPVVAAPAAATVTPVTPAAAAPTPAEPSAPVAGAKPASGTKATKAAAKESGTAVKAAAANTPAAVEQVPATTPVAVAPQPQPAPAAPAPAAPIAPAPAAAAGSARNMAVFKVDPALLGLPTDADVKATAVARQPGAAPAAAAPATEVASRPAKAKGGLVPGQIMPEPADAATSYAGPASAPGPRPAMGLARNMEAFRVDPALLAPEDRGPAMPVPATAIAAAPAPGVAPESNKGKPASKLSVVPSAVVGGVYLPPVYAGAAKDRKTVPVYVTADRIDGTSGVQSVATGRVDLIKADSRLRADTVVYREKEDEVEATGNVLLTRESDEISGPHLKLKLGDSVGVFDSPTFKVEPRPGKVSTSQYVSAPPMPGYGTAARLDFLGEDRYQLDKATYSTCVPGEDGQAWFAKSADLNLNYENNEGIAHDATLVFKGVPILYTPWLSFPLNRERKSGFLAPSWGTTTQGGFEFSLPYYWNIAPDMDATLTPRLMAKRGVQYRGELRYLGKEYNGIVNGEYLPNDNVTHTSRHALTLLHNQTLAPGLSGNLNLNGVSDDTYFTDLSSQINTVARTNLVREGRLTYGAGWWSATTLVQRYQTLQDPALGPAAKPYERLPQVVVNAARPDLPLGLAFNFTGEYVSFNHPDNTQVQGQRTTVYPQLSLPLQTAAFYVTPKIGVHNTRYQLQQQALGTPAALSRSVPIFSVDSGVTFERDTNYFGRDLIQTLEPRLYYLRVPLREQNNIPVFDTGLADFNFAQIFSENAFSGGDRIADANQVTLAASSRLISPTSGAELAKVAVGQRWYFSDQSVSLPGVPARTGHLADYLGAITARLDRDMAIDGAIQYNPRDKQLERFNAAVRYQPETTRILNAGYRYSRDLLSQIDVSGQWPLGGGWSGVGRYNYSIKDKRIVESVAGLEYNEACWAVRFVVQNVATATNRTSSAFFVQLQLNGFSSLGANPSNLLRRNVPGYDKAVEAGDEELLPK